MGLPAKNNSTSTDALQATVRRLKARTEALSERTRALETSSEQLRAATNRLRAKTSRLESDIERRERSEPPPVLPIEKAVEARGERAEEGDHV